MIVTLWCIFQGKLIPNWVEALVTVLHYCSWISNPVENPDDSFQRESKVTWALGEVPKIPSSGCALRLIGSPFCLAPFPVSFAICLFYLVRHLVRASKGPPPESPSPRVVPSQWVWLYVLVRERSSLLTMSWTKRETSFTVSVCCVSHGHCCLHFRRFLSISGMLHNSNKKDSTKQSDLLVCLFFCFFFYTSLSLPSQI